MHSRPTRHSPLGPVAAIASLAFLSACSSGGTGLGGAGSSGTAGTATGSMVAVSGAGTGSSVTSGTVSQATGSSTAATGVTTGTSVGGSGTVSTTGSASGSSGVATAGSGGSTTGVATSGASTGEGMPEGGVGGSGGSSGGTVGDAGHVMPSAGCGMPPNQVAMTFVQYMEAVTLPAGTNALWKNRDYYVWLPAGYDPNRAYTTVFLGPGCGGTGTMVVPVQMASKTNAIIIGLDPDPPAEGRPCFNTESPTTPEVPYFDATLAQVEAKFCVDTSRIFIAGFSSGSWLADTLGCVRAGVIRGQGNAAGELQGGLTCSGQPIAAMMVH